MLSKLHLSPATKYNEVLYFSSKSIFLTRHWKKHQLSTIKCIIKYNIYESNHNCETIRNIHISTIILQVFKAIFPILNFKRIPDSYIKHLFH